MVFIVAFVQIIVTHEIDHFTCSLGGFPFDIVGGKGGVGIFPVVQSAHGRVEVFGDFQPPVKMSVVNLISQAPDKDAGMVAVLTDPALQILLPPVFKIISVVIVSFCALPHVEALRVEKKPQFITEVQHMFRRHVMCVADGIYPHFFQDEELALQCRFIHG